MNKRVAIILINYKDYAKKYLAECFASLSKQDYLGEIKIFIVDNETSEESYNFIKQNVETHCNGSLQVEIIRNKNNDGFAKGNNNAIKLALTQGFDYMVLFNMDTVIEPNCVSEMVKEIEMTNEKNLPIGAIQARIMLWPEKEKINSVGNTTHFLGFGYCQGYNQKIRDHKSKIINQSICYPSGAAVLFTREVLEKVGLFDEEFWMYNEDQDLGWRIWLAGYQCVLAPDAVVYHKYEFSRSAGKYYWLDRNRVLSILKNYHFGTLFLIFPAFIIMELGLILFSLKSGWFKEKLKVWAYFFNPKHWPYLIRARQETQSLRKVKDCDIISMFSGKIWYQEIDDIKLRLINPVFNVYWRLIKKIVWW